MGAGDADAVVPEERLQGGGQDLLRPGLGETGIAFEEGRTGPLPA